MEVLEIELVHFYPVENSRPHHTDKFELVHQEIPSTIVRRGQPFTAVLRFVNRHYDRDVDNIKFVFSLGDNPHHLKGTQGIVTMKHDASDTPCTQWCAKFADQQDDTITVEITAPSNAPIGSWSLRVFTRAQGNPNPGYFDFQEELYILFNPWNKDDSVYMDEEKLLDEYVLNDVGKIWVGPISSCRGRHWVYGQFDAAILPACMLLLDRAEIPYESRHDPVKMSRVISKIVNSNDDQGVLIGRWDGEYGDGTAPAAWTGSVDILQQFLETQAEVSYGQCWVFAGVVTTVCRALGIPSRVVSNLVSAHDANASLSVDRYYTAEMEEIEGDPTNPDGAPDSIWNYHVWNDVWMQRNDLPKEYGGWQAIDATPQEPSGGFFQCGPASVEAIKQGLIGLGFDVDFMLASVNADFMRWKEDPNSDIGFTRVDCNKRHIGRKILTKKPFIFDPIGEGDREEITDLYKFREGSIDERQKLYNAAKASNRAKRFYDLPDSTREDLEFTLVDLEKVNVGDNFNVTLDVKNRSDKERTVKVVLRAATVFYTGKKAHLVQQATTKAILHPNSSEQLNLEVTSDEYLSKLVEYCNMKISATCLVQETGQSWAGEDDFQIIKPNIEIKVNQDVILRQEAIVTMTFRNPLKIDLTKCSFKVAGPGLVVRTLLVQHEDVGPNGMLRADVPLLPTKSGNSTLVVTFDSKELVDITGSASIEVFDE